MSREARKTEKSVLRTQVKSTMWLTLYNRPNPSKGSFGFQVQVETVSFFNQLI